MLLSGPAAAARGGRDDGDAAAVVHDHAVAALVAPAVMYGAHQDGVGLVGGAAVGPVTQVGGAGPAGGTVAARPAAGVGAGLLRPALGGLHHGPGAGRRRRLSGRKHLILGV